MGISKWRENVEKISARRRRHMAGHDLEFDESSIDVLQRVTTCLYYT